MHHDIKPAQAALRGFSLVELSIVLVILGLLVGGVLSGQALIRAAELRKITTANDKFRAAIFTFRDKYFALPSDMTNATAFWGVKVVAAGCPNNTGAAVNAADGTCDGDGDGIIYSASSTSSEYNRPWEQLSLAGLIEGAYRYSATSTLTETQATGVEFPAIGVGRGGARLAYIGPGGGGATNIHGSTGHFIRFGSEGITSGLIGGIIRPDEAFNIDTKIDDGRPGTGTFLAHYDPNLLPVVSTRCVTSFNSPNANYNMTFTNNGCSLFFRVN